MPRTPAVRPKSRAEKETPIDAESEPSGAPEDVCVESDRVTSTFLAGFEERLDRMERLLDALVSRQKTQDWYTTEQAAEILGKAAFTVREWARLGRIHAKKQISGRGAHTQWVVSHEELERFQREGLLPRRC